MKKRGVGSKPHDYLGVKPNKVVNDEERKKSYVSVLANFLSANPLDANIFISSNFNNWYF